jgi:hypothetical protein
MNTEESENKEISWTITIQSSSIHQEQIQAMIDQFIAQVEAAGVTRSAVRQARMEIRQIKGNRIEGALEMMRQDGMAEEQIERQRTFIMAQMGQGSWGDVVSAAERELAAHRAKGDVPQEVGAVYKLVEYAMNAGDKAKAMDYFRQAEQLLATTPLEDLLGKASGQVHPEVQAQTRQRYQSELERLRNWLF